MFLGQSFGLEVLGWLATMFIFVIGILRFFLIGVYISDISQTKQAIRRNYHVIGHFRYYFEHISTFSRQCFRTMGREKIPFNKHSLHRHTQILHKIINPTTQGIL